MDGFYSAVTTGPSARELTYPTSPMDWIAIISGFGIGAIVGMTGVGGGSLMTHC